jgi:hypothetical protein
MCVHDVFDNGISSVEARAGPTSDNALAVETGQDLLVFVIIDIVYDCTAEKGVQFIMIAL